MALEIERKFLLNYFPDNLMGKGTPIRQGYMTNKKDLVVRIRISANSSYITIKGPTIGTARSEYEYPIPEIDAEQMLKLFCKKPLVEKIRYQIIYKGFEWIIDQFSGDNHGLMVAEIELDTIDQSFEKPDWIGKEVTHDPRYFNSNLIESPYSTWQS